MWSGCGQVARRPGELPVYGAIDFRGGDGDTVGHGTLIVAPVLVIRDDEEGVQPGRASPNGIVDLTAQTIEVHSMNAASP
mgnify:CR=1 FL=1